MIAIKCVIKKVLKNKQKKYYLFPKIYLINIARVSYVYCPWILLSLLIIQLVKIESDPDSKININPGMRLTTLTIFVLK